jgi:uncharacterized protein involved in propanediol utilization
MDTIVIITYKSGTREAKFFNDPELLELIIDGFDYIADIEQIHFTGKLPTPPQPATEKMLLADKAVRDSIKRIGKAATRSAIKDLLE